MDTIKEIIDGLKENLGNENFAPLADTMTSIIQHETAYMSQIEELNKTIKDKKSKIDALTKANMNLFLKIEDPQKNINKPKENENEEGEELKKIGDIIDENGNFK